MEMVNWPFRALLKYKILDREENSVSSVSSDEGKDQIAPSPINKFHDSVMNMGANPRFSPITMKNREKALGQTEDPPAVFVPHKFGKDR